MLPGIKKSSNSSLETKEFPASAFVLRPYKEKDFGLFVIKFWFKFVPKLEVSLGL